MTVCWVITCLTHGPAGVVCINILELACMRQSQTLGWNQEGSAMFCGPILAVWVLVGWALETTSPPEIEMKLWTCGHSCYGLLFHNFELSG